jgi:hypothetical protein
MVGPLIYNDDWVINLGEETIDPDTPYDLDLFGLLIPGRESPMSRNAIVRSNMILQ